MAENKTVTKEYGSIEIRIPFDTYEDPVEAIFLVHRKLIVDADMIRACKNRQELVQTMQLVKDDLGQFYSVCSQHMKEKLRELEHTEE